MKRIRIKGLAEDVITRTQFRDMFHEIEEYSESDIPKDSDVVAEHSFDSLLQGGLDFANGLWLVIKGFGKMSMWAIIIIFSGLRWLWTRGVGKKDADAKKSKKE
jgi:hypothetical protein